jgi:hypothetical protein
MALNVLLSVTFERCKDCFAISDGFMIIMGKPPALPGDAQSLTVPGICAKASPL